jgi:hypothetical protein
VRPDLGGLLGRADTTRFLDSSERRSDSQICRQAVDKGKGEKRNGENEMSQSHGREFFLCNHIFHIRQSVTEITYVVITQDKHLC